jgi:hypothetical protein
MSATVAAAGNKLPVGLTNSTGIAALATLAAASGIKDASPAGLQAFATQVGMKLPTDLSLSGVAHAVASNALTAASGGVAGNVGMNAAGGPAVATGLVKLPDGTAKQLAAAAADSGIKIPTEMSPAGILAAASASGLTSGAYANKLHSVARIANIEMPEDMSPAGLAAAAVESYHALPEGSYSQISAAAAVSGIMLPRDVSPSAFATTVIGSGLSPAAFASELSTAAAAHGFKLSPQILDAIKGAGGTAALPH